MNKRRRFKAHRRRRIRLLAERARWRKFYKTLIFGSLYGTTQLRPDDKLVQQAIGAGFLHQVRPKLRWFRYASS